MGLLEKVVKSKRLQRLSGSLAMIIPEAWIRALNWWQQTEFMMEFKPGTNQIILTAVGKLGFKEGMTRKNATVTPDTLSTSATANQEPGCETNGEETGDPVVPAD